MIVYAMLYTAAVGIPIALAAVAIASLLRRHGRPERFVWLAALLTAFALPALVLLDPFGGPASVPRIPQAGVIGLPDVVVVPAESLTVDWGRLLVALWLLASVALAIRWAVAVVRLARAACSWQADTLDGVPVWRTDKLGPAVAGTLRPRVLVPRWLDSLPGSQRALVLLHEQEHIRARDPLLIALARAARVLAPWNPAVWLLTARLVRAVELDCDRRVLRRNADVAAYGHTLLTVSERRPGRLAVVAAFAESEAPLRSRILSMTTPSRTISVVALITSMVLGVVLMVGAFQIPVPAAGVPIGGRTAEGVGTPSPGPTVVVDRQSVGRARAEFGRQEAADALRRVPDAVEERGQENVARGGENVVEAGADRDASAGPTFTPYSVPPSLRNRDEVVQALVREYPSLLRDAGIGGSIRVYFFIDETGIVRDARVDQSSGHAALDAAALEVAKVYRFSPALDGGRAVPVWVSLPITFQVR